MQQSWVFLHPPFFSFCLSVLTFLLTKQSLFFFHSFYHTPLNELTNKQMMSESKNVFFFCYGDDAHLLSQSPPQTRNKSDFHYNYPPKLSCWERNTEITNFEILLVGVISSHNLVVSLWFDEKKTRFYRICPHYITFFAAIKSLRVT